MDSAAASDTPADKVLSPVDFAERYADRVHRFALLVSESAEDAEDVAQDALMAALIALPRYDPRRGTMDAWLWRIVANRWRDRGRRLTRMRAAMERLRSAEAPHHASPEAIALEHLDDDALIARVRCLPPAYRTVVALRYAAGLSVEETAKSLDTTPMAIKHRARRALDMLRVQLGGMRDDN